MKITIEKNGDIIINGEDHTIIFCDGEKEESALNIIDNREIKGRIKAKKLIICGDMKKFDLAINAIS